MLTKFELQFRDQILSLLLHGQIFSYPDLFKARLHGGIFHGIYQVGPTDFVSPPFTQRIRRIL
jgi:hypothetical protein